MNFKKTLKGLAAITFAGIAAVALAASSSSAGAPAGLPKATFVKGDVTASGAAGTFAKVKRNQQLVAGGSIKTGADSRAELTFPDGSVVRLGPSSELKLGSNVAFDGKTKSVKVETELVGGAAWAKVATLVGSDAQFKVKTQNAVAGVRGTVFRVNVDKDEATVVKVYNGSVAVGAPAIIDNTPSKECEENPIKCSRKEIKPPMVQVDPTKFELLLGEMMQVKIVGKPGLATASVPAAFTAADDNNGEPEWVRWNNARDAGKDSEKSD